MSTHNPHNSTPLLDELRQQLTVITDWKPTVSRYSKSPPTLSMSIPGAARLDSYNIRLGDANYAFLQRYVKEFDFNHELVPSIDRLVDEAYGPDPMRRARARTMLDGIIEHTNKPGFWLKSSESIKRALRYFRGKFMCDLANNLTQQRAVIWYDVRYGLCAQLTTPEKIEKALPFQAPIVISTTEH